MQSSVTPVSLKARRTSDSLNAIFVRGFALTKGYGGVQLPRAHGVVDGVVVGVGVGVNVAVGVGVNVAVAVGVNVAVEVGVNVAVAVEVGVGVNVAVGVGVNVAVGVGVGVGTSQSTKEEPSYPPPVILSKKKLT